MDYTEAVALAKRGEEAGYNFLYEETYQSKYYLALKYMHNEEAAKDVVQDAYIRAFDKLDTLENPEKFVSWLGIIVANTAKNALQKQNPMLFTDIAKDSEEGAFEYQIEDESTKTQPEVAYSQKETQELVHELIGSLSEEQRMCILMFHIEGQSISEIAEVLGCSENTVKSRLNYGRKNIKVQAEELQKKGYKLYTVAPIPFLLYLLKSEEQILAAEGALDVAGKAMAEGIADRTGHTSLLHSVGAKGAANAVKQGFFHTFAGKIAAAGIGLCLVGAGAAAIITFSQKNDERPVNTTNIEENGEEKNTGEEKKPEADTKPEETETEVTDEQYPELLAGGLTKAQFQFVLGYGPVEMKGGRVSMGDLHGVVFRVGTDGKYHDIGIETIGNSETGLPLYRLSDINNLISVLTDYQYSEQDSDKHFNEKVSGDTLAINVAEPDDNSKTTIHKAVLKGDTMTVEYQVDRHRFNNDTGEDEYYTDNRTAILKKLENGTYRVTDIICETIDKARKEAYSKILMDICVNHVFPYGADWGYDGVSDMANNKFAVYDVDADGADELILKYTTSAMADMREVVYNFDSRTGTTGEEFMGFPALTYYDNGFIRADDSHNQSDDPEAWSYTMYQYDEAFDFYKEVGTGVTNDGSVESYVGGGKEVNLPYLDLTEENIQSIK